MTKATVLGAGSFGTALAKLLGDKGYEVLLWARREEQAEEIQGRRENRDYLPGMRLPDSLLATHDLERAMESSDLVLSVVPSHGLRSLLREYGHLFPRESPIVSASKGIENDSLKLMSEVFEELLPERLHRQLAYLSGPSFAKEVALGMPTAVSIAGHDIETCERAQSMFNTERFRVYTTEDVVGVELGGALKNVVAIAAGVGDGMGLGHNSRAAIITRGLAEIARLAIHRGANPMTLAGLSGVGDLVLTCTGELSRNRKVGIDLGRGRKLDEILGSMNMVAEGVRTSKSTYHLAKREGVDMPIASEVYCVLFEAKDPKEAMTALMTRPLKHERR